MPATDLTLTEIDRLLAAEWYAHGEAQRHNWHDLAATNMREINNLLDQRNEATCPPPSSSVTRSTTSST